MALLEEQFTETLEAGAPDITYKGNEGQEQKIARELWDKLPPQAQQQFGNFQQFFSSGAWKQVLEMLQQQMQQGQQPQQTQQGIGSMMPAQMADGGMLMASASDPMDDKNQISLSVFGKPLHELTPDEEMQLDEYMHDKAQKWGGAYGGVAGADGRKAYGIGSWFQKKIMDPIKKNIVPAAATAYGLYSLGGGKYGIPGIGSGEGFDIGNIFKGGGTLSEILKKPEWTIPAASLVAGAFAKPEQQLEGGAMSRGAGINLQDIAKLANITDEKQGQAIGLNFLPEASARKYSPEEMALTYSQAGKAQGGRIGAQEGGLMSLGGMEMDLRGGGFVPLGAQEKADDVPARLSKNEFVFTADAVRAAGGGNVDEGADKMYRTMKQLESRVG